MNTKVLQRLHKFDCAFAAAFCFSGKQLANSDFALWLSHFWASPSMSMVKSGATANSKNISLYTKIHKTKTKHRLVLKTKWRLTDAKMKAKLKNEEHNADQIKQHGGCARCNSFRERWLECLGCITLDHPCPKNKNIIPGHPKLRTNHANGNAIHPSQLSTYKSPDVFKIELKKTRTLCINCQLKHTWLAREGQMEYFHQRQAELTRERDEQERLARLAQWAAEDAAAAAAAASTTATTTATTTTTTTTTVAK